MSSMKIAYWKDDPAAQNIVQHLRSDFEDSIFELEQSVLFSPEPDFKEAMFCVIPSTHKSETGKPALTVHPTGNFATSDLGGNPKEVSYAWPPGMKTGIQYLAQHTPEGFEVVMEATHHGPTEWETPLLFIEIGSDPSMYSHEEAGCVVADAIRAMMDQPASEFEHYVGFGGLHYTPAFTPKLIAHETFALGHVVPKYGIDALDAPLMQQLFEKSFAEKAVIDWKGLKSEARQKVLSLLNEAGFDYVKVSDI